VPGVGDAVEREVQGPGPVDPAVPVDARHRENR
jgi:hypothetical protein